MQNISSIKAGLNMVVTNYHIDNYNPSSHVIRECLSINSNLAGTAGIESYPTPISNPSHTPKPANCV
ncbi:hypothetical protein DPV78_000146 [Talaromyces pinophilus]|nr:hypothetical protein DPV78_000146 [Talaromyces pinophilus]